jgi:hypothetical protein
MENDKIDLSPLDLARDGARWERMIQGVVTRALAAPLTVRAQLAAWARPVLAVAALAAAVAWAPLVLGGRAAETARLDAASALAEWAAGDHVPATNEVWTALESSDAAR